MMSNVLFLFSHKPYRLLFLTQILVMASMTSIVLTVSLIAQEITPNQSWTTLPFTFVHIGATIASYFVGMLLRQYRKNIIFAIGHLLAMIATILVIIAIYQDSFILLCLAGIIYGFQNGFWIYYRYAASEMFDEDQHANAIAVITSAGVLAAILGPNLVLLTHDILGVPIYIFSYVGLAILHFIALILIINIDFTAYDSSSQPSESSHNTQDQSKALRLFTVGALSAAIGYGVMGFIMVATPLAMHHAHHSFASTSFVIQSHVIAMYAPAIFVGYLIKRFSAKNIIMMGHILLLSSVGFALISDDVIGFWLSLVALGVGWSFTYVTGSSLIAQSAKLNEKSKYKPIGEFAIVGTTGTAVLSAGVVFALGGWYWVILLSSIIIFSSFITQIWLRTKN